MALGCPHCCRLQPRSPASMWPLVTTCDRIINTDSGCGRTRDRHGPRCHRGPRKQRRLPGPAWPLQQHGHHTPTWPQASAHTPNINKVLHSLRNHRYQHRHWLWFDHRPRHGPHLQPWSGQYHGPSSQRRPDPSVPSWGIALRHPHSNRLQQRPKTSAWPMVASWVRDINTDPGCCRTIDTDMILKTSPSQVVSMAPGGCAGHPGWHVP